MSTGDAVSFLLACGFVAWFAVRLIKYITSGSRKLLRRLNAQRIDFRLNDVPLSPIQWQKFCALALAKGISQKRLLADMITFYFDEIVR